MNFNVKKMKMFNRNQQVVYDLKINLNFKDKSKEI